MSIRASVYGGLCGSAQVLRATSEQVNLKLICETSPPAKLPISLVVGLCRPQSVKKVIQAAVCFGVTELHFIRTQRSQKSYLDAEVLGEESILEQQILGLEQSCGSEPVEIFMHTRFKPFIEDVLPDARRGGSGVIAVTPRVDRVDGESLNFDLGSISNSRSVWLAVGGEAGFNDFEIESFVAAGFTAVSLGCRILRIEQAVVAGIGAILQARAG
jgi:RsmE family RNA methyltransferase